MQFSGKYSISIKNFMLVKNLQNDKIEWRLSQIIKLPKLDNDDSQLLE